MTNDMSTQSDRPNVAMDLARLVTRQACLDFDAAHPLRSLRDQFLIPEGLIYLDGNSLGVLPKATPDALHQTIHQAWGQDLITSWNKAGWMQLPQEIGTMIASLIGAHADEVIAADSTSINLFKVLAAAIQQNPNRKKIISERGNFPTDLYMVEGLVSLLKQNHELVLIDDIAELAGALDESVAIVLLTQVDYRSGKKLAMTDITKQVHASGALMIWDLAHSAGAFAVDLNLAQADYAVGCGYKYLNGGPGAPAFIYVARRHHAHFNQPLSGWLGHAAPFDFEPGYRPAPGVNRAICGTAPILSMVALACGVKATLSANSLGGIAALEVKGAALTELFLQCTAPLKALFDLTPVCPTYAFERGNQVSFSLPDGMQAYALVQALIARNVVGDFRAPNILRFGFAPLYVSFTDAWDAAQAIKEILETKSWNQPQFKARSLVT